MAVVKIVTTFVVLMIALASEGSFTVQFKAWPYLGESLLVVLSNVDEESDSGTEHRLATTDSIDRLWPLYIVLIHFCCSYVGVLVAKYAHKMCMHSKSLSLSLSIYFKLPNFLPTPRI